MTILKGRRLIRVIKQEGVENHLRSRSEMTSKIKEETDAKTERNLGCQMVTDTGKYDLSPNP